MFGLNFKFIDERQNVQKAADKGAYRSFAHAAASINKSAKESIKKAPKDTSSKTRATKRDARGRFLKGSGKKSKRTHTLPSRAGTPPHTRRGQLKRAIMYSANKQGAVIGPRRSIVGTSAEAHEFGKRYKGTKYDERPFMGPALTANQARFAGAFAGSI